MPPILSFLRPTTSRGDHPLPWQPGPAQGFSLLKLFLLLFRGQALDFCKTPEDNLPCHSINIWIELHWRETKIYISGTNHTTGEPEHPADEYLILHGSSPRFRMCQWVSKRVFGRDVVLNNERARPGLDVPQASNLLKNQTDLRLHAATTAQCHIFLLQPNSFNLFP